MILNELEGLPGFIIGRHNLINICYTDNTMLIADSKGRLK